MNTTPTWLATTRVTYNTAANNPMTEDVYNYLCESEDKAYKVEVDQAVHYDWLELLDHESQS